MGLKRFQMLKLERRTRVPQKTLARTITRRREGPIGSNVHRSNPDFATVRRELLGPRSTREIPHMDVAILVPRYQFTLRFV